MKMPRIMTLIGHYQQKKSPDWPVIKKRYLIDLE